MRRPSCKLTETFMVTCFQFGTWKVLCFNLALVWLVGLCIKVLILKSCVMLIQTSSYRRARVRHDDSATFELGLRNRLNEFSYLCPNWIRLKYPSCKMLELPSLFNKSSELVDGSGRNGDTENSRHFCSRFLWRLIQGRSHCATLASCKSICRQELISLS